MRQIGIDTQSSGGSGGTGASNFSQLGGAPRDNASLAAELNALTDPTELGAAVAQGVTTATTAAVTAATASVGQTIDTALVDVSAGAAAQSFDLSLVGATVQVGAANGTEVGDLKGLADNASVEFDNSKFRVVRKRGGEAKVVVGDGYLMDPGVYPLRAHQAVSGNRDSHGTLYVTATPAGRPIGSPWGIDWNKERVVNAWLQETLAEGPVTDWPTTGYSTVKCKTVVAGAEVVLSNHQVHQPDDTKRPVKLAGNAGVRFQNDQHLLIGNDPFRWVGTRCCLTVYKVNNASAPYSMVSVWMPDGDGFSDDPAAVSTSAGYNNGVIGIGVNSYAQSLTGAIRFSKLDGVHEYTWGAASNGRNQSYASGLAANDWIVVVQYHRDGYLHTRVNGRLVSTVGDGGFCPVRASLELARPDFRRMYGRVGNYYKALADGVVRGNAPGTDFTIDCRVELAGDMSDKLIEKLEWWAHERVSKALPVGHPYVSVDPVIEHDDYSVRQQMFSVEEWQAIQQAHSLRKDSDVGLRLSPTLTGGFDTPIFKEDWRANRISNRDTSDRTQWYVAGGLAGNTTGININTPERYDANFFISDAPNNTMTLVLKSNGAPAISTVNGVDNGVTFEGELMVKQRFRFNILSGNRTTPPQGMFHCPGWSFSNDRAKYPRSPSTEIDFTEIDFPAPTFGNIMTIHWHIPKAIDSTPQGRLRRDQRVKLMGNDMVPYGTTFVNEHGSSRTNTRYQNLTQLINQNDGQWHETTVIYGQKWTVCAIDGVVLGKIRTHESMLRRWHWLANTAARNTHGSGEMPQNGESYGMVLGPITIYKRDADLAKFAYPFTARPKLSIPAYVGRPLVVNPMLAVSGQVRYEWYEEDGYYRNDILGNSYTPPVAEVGKRFRVKCVAIADTDQPFAWTDISPSIESGRVIPRIDLDFANGVYQVWKYSGATSSWDPVTMTLNEVFAYVSQLGFARASGASLLNADGSVTVDVGRNVPRVVSGKGLLYEPTGFNNIKQLDSTGTFLQSDIGLKIAPASVNGPAGNGVGYKMYDNALLQTGKGRVTYNTIGMTNGQRATFQAVVKAGTRSWIAVSANSGTFGDAGSGKSYYDLVNGVVNANGADASIEPLHPSAPGWWVINWSRVVNIKTAGEDPAIWLWAATGDGSNDAYAGTDNALMYEILQANVMPNGPLKMAHPHLVYGPRSPESLTIPVGSTTRAVVVTSIDPVTGSDVTQTFNVANDWVMSGVTGNYIKRIRIDSNGSTSSTVSTSPVVFRYAD